MIISAINEVTEKMNNKDLHDRTVLCLIDVMNNRCSLLAAYQKHFEVCSLFVCFHTIKQLFRLTRKAPQRLFPFFVFIAAFTPIQKYDFSFSEYSHKVYFVFVIIAWQNNVQRTLDFNRFGRLIWCNWGTPFLVEKEYQNLALCEFESIFGWKKSAY